MELHCKNLIFRNRPEKAIVYDNETKDQKVEIMRASLYVRVMTVNDNAFSGLETTLTKTHALYHSTEIMPKTSLISTGWQRLGVTTT